MTRPNDRVGNESAQARTERPKQLDLFAHVAKAYAITRASELTNEELYCRVASLAKVDGAQLNRAEPIGRAGRPHSVMKRKIRWYQQSLKHMGVLERVKGRRGVWRLTERGEKELHKPVSRVMLHAFSTELGVAVWSRSERALVDIGAPIALVITSPPYPLRRPRAYGNPSEQDYVDFVCKSLEPLVAQLLPGGSICLNISNDIFVPGSPSRSLYCERLIIALCDRLGLHLVDRIVWYNKSKPPGPVQWASVKRVQLNVAWEPILWFTNDPHRLRANNTRVLQPHTERHLRLMERGGEHRASSFADGAYRIRPGSFRNSTPGRIARNVLEIAHNCPSQKRYKAAARELGLPVHGAPQPLSLVRFFIEFLTEVGDLVADLWAGSFTGPLAAEQLGRRWYGREQILEYVRGSAERFRDANGFWINPALVDLGNDNRV